jgi:hypothetical protein
MGEGIEEDARTAKGQLDRCLGRGKVQQEAWRTGHAAVQVGEDPEKWFVGGDDRVSGDPGDGIHQVQVISRRLFHSLWYLQNLRLKQ